MVVLEHEREREIDRQTERARERQKKNVHQSGTFYTYFISLSLNVMDRLCRLIMMLP